MSEQCLIHDRYGEQCQNPGRYIYAHETVVCDKPHGQEIRKSGGAKQLLVLEWQPPVIIPEKPIEKPEAKH